MIICYIISYHFTRTFLSYLACTVLLLRYLQDSPQWRVSSAGVYFPGHMEEHDVFIPRCESRTAPCMLDVDTFLFVPPLSVLPVCTLSKYQKRACSVRSSRCARGRNVRIAPTPPHPNSVEKVMLQKAAFHSYGSRAVGRRFNYVRFLFLNMCATPFCMACFF